MSEEAPSSQHMKQLPMALKRTKAFKLTIPEAVPRHPQAYNSSSSSSDPQAIDQNVFCASELLCFEK